MIKWINGQEPKTIRVNGKKTIVGHWNIYIAGTNHFVTLSPEEIKQYIPNLGARQKYCYEDLLDCEIEYLFGKVIAEVAIA